MLKKTKRKPKEPKRLIILGAAGRDFHDFNVLFRKDTKHKVVCFTAAQIPNIDNRKYPPELAGKRYPKGIPIYPEEKLPKLIKRFRAGLVVLAYSDIPYINAMRKAAIANASGADFCFIEPGRTMLKSVKPVIAVTAVRTGCGKSQATQRVCEILKSRNKRVVVIRHPMPYGNLKKQACQRFASVSDFKKHECTIEEMEEYMPHIERGTVVYAGVDYEKIMHRAEKEADVIVFDGGNNDCPFFVPNLWIVLLDPLRPGHERAYYPGEINLRMADIAIINKTRSAKKKDIETVRSNIKQSNPRARIIEAESAITVDSPALIRNKKVLVIEDGPTLTHGEMNYGAGIVAAKRFHARAVDPRRYAVGSVRRVYRKYPQLGPLLPAMGYSKTQVKELERSINRTPCDAVVVATPVDLRKVINIKRPVVKVSYVLKTRGRTKLEYFLKKFL